MDDLKGIHSDSSGSFAGRGSVSNSDEASAAASNMWDHLEKEVGAPTSSEEGDQFHQYGSYHDPNADYSSELEGEESLDEPIRESDFEMPAGFEDLPASENFLGYPSAENEGYQGPSADGGYQSPDDLMSAIPSTPDDSQMESDSEQSADDSTKPVFSAPESEDKTVSIQQDLNVLSAVAQGTSTDADRTIAVEGFANARLGARKKADVDVKVSVGNFRNARAGVSNVMTSVDASLAQAENFKIAQQRILELEKEVEMLRAENEELASAGEIIRTRTDEFAIRITALEKEKVEIRESAQSELLILKGNLQYKETEVAKARNKVEELETRLKSDFKKIRVRERELENRLELVRAEKNALVRSKDEYILEQKRKIDQLSQELDNYRKKCLELNKTIEANQDQVKRTERALRLALTNLEAKEGSLVPLKKAE